MKTLIDGQLEIDHDRGVIYFHITNEKEIVERGMVITAVRISNLPRPIPQIDGRMLDIRAGVCDWKGEQFID